MSEATVSIQDVIDYIDFLNNAKKLSNMYKESFEAYIKDKSLPLELRWQLWLNAPSDMKDYWGDIYHWDSVDEDYVFGDRFSRYQSVRTVDLIETVAEMSPEELEDFKEEILENNLEGYEYDW